MVNVETFINLSHFSPNMRKQIGIRNIFLATLCTLLNSDQTSEGGSPKEGFSVMPDHHVFYAETKYEEGRGLLPSSGNFSAYYELVELNIALLEFGTARALACDAKKKGIMTLEDMEQIEKIIVYQREHEGEVKRLGVSFRKEEKELEECPIAKDGLSSCLLFPAEKEYRSLHEAIGALCIHPSEFKEEMSKNGGLLYQTHNFALVNIMRGSYLLQDNDKDGHAIRGLASYGFGMLYGGRIAVHDLEIAVTQELPLNIKEESYNSLVEIYESNMELDNAISALERQRDIDGYENVWHPLSGEKRIVYTLDETATIYVRKGEREKAKAALQQASAYATQAHTHTWIAAGLLNLNAPVLACEEAEKAITMDPENGWGYLFKGYCVEERTEQKELLFYKALNHGDEQKDDALQGLAHAALCKYYAGKQELDIAREHQKWIKAHDLPVIETGGIDNPYYSYVCSIK